MARTRQTDPRVALLMALLLSAALSGCLGKEKDREDDRSLPILDWLRRTGPDHGPGTPPSCDGCLPLEPPRPTKPLPPDVRGPTNVTVPLPADGDVLGVHGRLLHLSEPDGAAPFPFPLEEQDYKFTLQAATGHDASTIAEFSITSEAGTVLTPDGPLAPTQQTMRVRLDDRGVDQMDMHTLVTEGDGFLDGHQVPYTVDWTLRPHRLDLFWLGADLWGRTLNAGDTFASSWTPPGAPNYEVRFSYRVEAVQSNPIDDHAHDHHHGHGHAASAGAARTVALVILSATDSIGNHARWMLTMSEDTPYPLAVQREHHRVSAEIGQLFLPPLIDFQLTWLIERGNTSLPWGTAGPNTADVQGVADTVYRFDERLASAVLDHTPAYPLDDAVADLLLLLPEFRVWWDSHPGRVLLEAELVPVHLADLAEPARELAWRLVFAGGDGAANGWRAARMETAGHLTTVAHDTEALGPVHVPYRLRILHVDDLAHVTMATGEAAADHLKATTGGTTADYAHFALTLTGADLGGVLRLARLPPHGAISAGVPHEPYVSGHVTEDLATGALVSSLVSGPF